MRLKAILLNILFILSFPSLTNAGVYQEKLEQCLDKNVSLKEKEDFTKWTFFLISANPNFAKFSQIPPKDLLEADKKTAKLFERIYTENCSKEIRDVLKNEGTNALEHAFEFLGRSSIQTLMSNEAVQYRLEEAFKHADSEKMYKAISIYE